MTQAQAASAQAGASTSKASVATFSDMTTDTPNQGPEAQANRDLVGAERRAAEVSARATLFALHRQLSQAVAETQTLQNVVAPRVKEALDETQYAYDRGRYSYLELVDAQREFLSTRADLIEAAAQAHTLRAEIERLTNAPVTALPITN